MKFPVLNVQRNWTGAIIAFGIGACAMSLLGLVLYGLSIGLTILLGMLNAVIAVWAIVTVVTAAAYAAVCIHSAGKCANVAKRG